jgi:hypothetical protein
MDDRIQAQDQPPNLTILQMLAGRWVSQAISTAAHLGVADALAGGPQAPEAIAERIGAHAPTLRRLLRALASVGIFAEDDAGRFRQTPASEVLRADVPGSLRGMAMYMGSRAAALAWADLPASVRTGEPAFRRVHGKSFFEHLGASPDDARAFDRGMHGVSSGEIPAILAAYDFGAFGTIVDVGGGDGTLLAAILDRHPGPRGVLVDVPHALEHARERLRASPHGARIELVPGSFFEAVPPGGDAYLLKHIVHDWDDERAVQILRSCRRAMPAHARLLVIDAVLQPGNDPHFGKLLDLEMLAITEGGRERTEREHAALLEAAGLRLARVVPTLAPPALVEAVPA